MTAAALLRDMDGGATPAPWAYIKSGTAPDYNEVDSIVSKDRRFLDALVAMEPHFTHGGSPQTGTWVTPEGEEADMRLIATTRNLLPELAALVEAVGEWRIAGERHLMEPDFHERLARTENALVLALDTLNAKAGEVK